MRKLEKMTAQAPYRGVSKLACRENFLTFTEDRRIGGGTNLDTPFHSIKYLQIVQFFLVATESSNDVKFPLERGLN